MRIVKLSGTEELLQFRNAAYPDFELRQGDEVAFFYVKDELHSVHNFTIGEVFKISKSPCYLATCVYGPASDEVALLRLFRDEVLEPKPILAGMVRLYYWISPTLIRHFGDTTFAKTVIGTMISPAIWLFENG